MSGAPVEVRGRVVQESLDVHRRCGKKKGVPESPQQPITTIEIQSGPL